MGGFLETCAELLQLKHCTYIERTCTMKTVDLHVHSHYSDGTLSPEEIVALAIEKGLSAIALTDHDSIRGVKDALAAQQKYNNQVKVIPGVELSVGYKNGDIHIVGLFVDYENPLFIETSNLLIKRRDDRNREMIKRLQDAGIPITMEALLEENPDTVITRANFGRFLCQNHFAASMQDAFNKYLNEDTPFYVPRKYLTPKEGIDLILKTGGVPILAHPLHYQLGEKELEQLLTELLSYGLVGMEVKYSNHTLQDEYFASSLAAKHHLLKSGGSDFHGSNKPDIALGSGRGNLKVPYSYLEELAKHARNARDFL